MNYIETCLTKYKQTEQVFFKQEYISRAAEKNNSCKKEDPHQNIGVRVRFSEFCELVGFYQNR